MKQFSSNADTPLWELWCEGVSGCCYQKGSPLDIESIFQVGERCLHTDAPTRHILHLDTITAKSSRTHTPYCPNSLNCQKYHTRQITPHPLYTASVCHPKIVLDKSPLPCHNTPVFSLFSDFKLFHENFLL